MKVAYSNNIVILHKSWLRTGKQAEHAQDESAQREQQR